MWKSFPVGYMPKVGDVPTYEAIAVMKNYGIDITSHKATNIIKSNLNQMDLILCATNSQKFSVTSMYPEVKGKVYTMKEYAIRI